MKDKYQIMIMGSYNYNIARMIAGFSKIRVEYYIKDESVDDGGAFEEYWASYGAEKGELTEAYTSRVDFIFVCGYTRIIKSDLLSEYIFVNIHAGNLPKWRGTSANSWAIINGDCNIAYTLHRVTEELDGGPIYAKFEYMLRDDEKYGDGRKKLEVMLEEGLEDVMVGICEGRIEAQQQTGKYVYCSSFRKEDGLISDWNIATAKILGLFKVFGSPYGSGLFFRYQGGIYEIMDVTCDTNYDCYEGIPGAVVNKNNEYVWIKTSDTVIQVKKIRNQEGNILKASQLLKIGTRLHSFMNGRSANGAEGMGFLI